VVRRIVGSLEFDSVAVLFKSAVGVVVDDAVLEIESVVPLESAGLALCYRIALKTAVAW
jgi:hypothetical protein